MNSRMVTVLGFTLAIHVKNVDRRLRRQAYQLHERMISNTSKKRKFIRRESYGNA